MPALTLLIAAAGVLLTAAGGSASVKTGRVVTYPAPAGQPLSSDYVVKVRPLGGAWRDLDEYRVTVDMDTLSKATMVAFDAGGPVEVSIRKISGGIASARVRPLSYNIKPSISADRTTATFTLPRPLKVSFEANGDIFHNVHVFENPIEQDAPRPGPKVIYFRPGIHKLPGNHVLRIPSNTTVYIAGGAVVQGALLISHAHNVVVRGHGILDPSAFFDYDADLASIVTDGATDVGFRDFTIIGAVNAGFDLVNSKRVVISNVKEFGFYRFGDGIDVQASSDVLVDDAFLRTSDDSVAVFASTPWGAHGNSRNITVRNSSLWADVAHAVLVGALGDPNERNSIDNVFFENIDVLEHDEDNDRYQGALAVNAGDQVSVSNVQFENVRVEDFTEGQLVNVQVFFNTDYNKKPGSKVDRVFFRNLIYHGESEQPSHVEGYDGSREVTNVVFENLKRNGSTVLNARDGNILVGPYASRVIFRGQPSTVVWNDDFRAIRYLGRWVHRPARTRFRGDEHAAQAAGARVRFAFRGRQARVYGATSPSSGRTSVYIDGALAGTVDAYSRAPRTQQLLFDTGVLASGLHRMELRLTGARDPLSTGSSVRLDKVEIIR